MHIDELTRELHDAAAAEPAADAAAGRDAVARRVRHHQTRRVAAIAVCVLVLLGAFAVTVSRIGTRDAGYATSTAGMPKLVPSNLPDGLRIKVLAARPDELSIVPMDDVHVSVLAKPGATPPDGVTVTKVRIGSSGTGGSTPPTSATVDPTKVETDADGVRATGRIDPDGSTILVTSPTLDAAALTEMARSVRFAPGGEVDLSSVPAGYDRVVSNARTFWFATSLMASRGTPGYAQLYAAPALGTPGSASRSGGPLNDEKNVTLSALAAGPADLEAARWTVPNAQSRTVRGHPGVAGTHQISTYGRYSVLRWMENDATLVQLSSSTYPIDELARIAEGLRVDPTDFRDLEAATTTTTLNESCRRLSGGGVICQTQSQGSSGGAGSCTPEEPPASDASATGERGRITCQGTAIDTGEIPTTAPSSPPTASTTTP